MKRKRISGILLDVGSGAIKAIKDQRDYAEPIFQAKKEISDLVERELEELYGGINSTREDAVEIWDEAITAAIRRLKIVLD